jgi:hypothetical protein
VVGVIAAQWFRLQNFPTIQTAEFNPEDFWISFTDESGGGGSVVVWVRTRDQTLRMGDQRFGEGCPGIVTSRST